jgi:hypothetical protein
MIQAVIYQTSTGEKIRICPACERKLKAAGEWPKNGVGEEYHSVSRGLAPCNWCDIHDPESDHYMPEIAAAK